MTRKGRRVQNHHISYEPEVTVTVYAGEHEILGKMNYYSRKTVSQGFIKALLVWIFLNERRSVDLDES